MGYNPGDIDDNIIKYILSGDFVIIHCNISNNLKTFTLWYHVTENFIDFLSQSEKYNPRFNKDSDENPVKDYMIDRMIVSYFINEYSKIQEYYYDEDLALEAKYELYNDIKEAKMQYKNEILAFFEKYHKDYQKYLIYKTIDFFTPIPEKDYNKITNFHSIALYHNNVYKDTLDDLYVKFTILPSFNIHIVGIEKNSETNTTMFTIAIPDEFRRLGGYIRYIADFSETFKSMYYSIIRMAMYAKYGFAKIQNINLIDKFHIDIKFINFDDRTDYSKSDELARKYFARIADVLLKK